MKSVMQEINDKKRLYAITVLLGSITIIFLHLYFDWTQHVIRYSRKTVDVSRAFEPIIDQSESMESLVQDNATYSPYTKRWLQKRQELLSLGGRKKVLLYCYMRGGSTFFSELFRNNPHVMYWYEPLTAHYTSVYGVRTWTYPLDLFWKRDSRQGAMHRKQPEWELEGIAQFNHDILTCNFSALPGELFLNGPALVKSNFGAFQTCVRHATVGGIDRCHSHIASQCSGNIMNSLYNKCHERITETRMLLSTNQFARPALLPFKKYVQCVEGYSKSIQFCTNRLVNRCRASSMVTYKGLRITMDSIEKMLEIDPDLYVIYNIRDPRGTVTSRLESKHLFTVAQQSSVIESKYLCQRMLYEFKSYKRITERYPGSILLVKYEDVVNEPYEQLKQIYNFYNMSVHQNVYDWVKKSERASNNGGRFSTIRANSSASINKWRTKHSNNIQQQMTEYCKEVLLAHSYTL